MLGDNCERLARKSLSSLDGANAYGKPNGGHGLWMSCWEICDREEPFRPSASSCSPAEPVGSTPFSSGRVREGASSDHE
jgi:hypothetical protein